MVKKNRKNAAKNHSKKPTEATLQLQQQQQQPPPIEVVPLVPDGGKPFFITYMELKQRRVESGEASRPLKELVALKLGKAPEKEQPANKPASAAPVKINKLGLLSMKKLSAAVAAATPAKDGASNGDEKAKEGGEKKELMKINGAKASIIFNKVHMAKVKKDEEFTPDGKKRIYTVTNILINKYQAQINFIFSAGGRQ